MREGSWGGRRALHSKVFAGGSQYKELCEASLGTEEDFTLVFLKGGSSNFFLPGLLGVLPADFHIFPVKEEEPSVSELQDLDSLTSTMECTRMHVMHHKNLSAERNCA